MSEALDKVESFQRSLLAELLEKCTEKQQGIFARIYPDGVAKMPLGKVPWATEQVERTVQKNKETDDD